MIKRFVIAMALVMAMALPAAAASNVNGIYLGAKFIDSIQTRYGSGDLTNSLTQNTVGGGIFVGYDFFPKFDVPLRAELEYAIRSSVTQNESSSGYVDGAPASASMDSTWGVQTLMANFYFDFHNSTAFTPYIGAGLGFGFVRSEYDLSATWGARSGSMSKSQTDTVFAWNVGAGCSYAFNENISADLAYRFVGLGESEVKMYGVKMNTYGNAHEFSLGLRFTF